MENVIFLAIDGVLTPWQACSEKGANSHDPASINALKQILTDLPHTGLVIMEGQGMSLRSSRIRARMVDLGIDAARIVGVTPDLRYEVGGNRVHPPRHEEIRAWLFQNPSVLRYAIIDNADYREYTGMEDDFFAVEPEIGLTQHIANRVTGHLIGWQGVMPTNINDSFSWLRG